MVLIEADRARPWLPGVLASDASLRIRRGTALVEHLGRVRCGSGARSEEMEMRGGEDLRDCFGLAEMTALER